MALNPKTTGIEKVKALATAVVGLCILGVFIVLLGGNRFWEEYVTYRISFDSVKDLTPGRPVKFGGLDVGKVTGIAIDPNDPSQIIVEIGIREGFDLYGGTRASISQKGLVGDNYVLLEISKPVGERLSPGAVLPAKNALSMNDVAQRIGELVDTLSPKLTRVAEGLEKVFDEKNLGNLDKVLTRAPELVREAEAAVGSIRADWHRLTSTVGSDVTRTAQALQDVSEDTARVMVTVERVLTELNDELAETLVEMRKRVATTLDNVDDLTVSLDKDLAYDQEKLSMILDDVDQLAGELRQLVRSLKERPWQIIYKPQGSAVP